MNKVLAIVVSFELAILASLVFIGSVLFIETSKEDPKVMYEYKVEYIDDTEGLKINDEGSKGWRVVSARRAKDGEAWGYEYMLEKKITVDK